MVIQGTYWSITRSQKNENLAKVACTGSSTWHLFKLFMENNIMRYGYSRNGNWSCILQETTSLRHKSWRHHRYVSIPELRWLIPNQPRICVHTDPKDKVDGVDGTFRCHSEEYFDLKSTMKLSFVLVFCCCVTKLNGLNQHLLFITWTRKEGSTSLLRVGSAETAQQLVLSSWHLDSLCETIHVAS